MANSLEQIAELRAKLAEMGMEEADIEKMVAKAQKTLSAGSVTGFVSAMTKAANHDKLADLRVSMAGMKLNVSIVFGEDGTPEVSGRLTKPSTGGGSRGSKKVHVVDGVEYKSGAEACRELGIEVGSDSAARKLRSYAKQNNVEYTVEDPEAEETE